MNMICILKTFKVLLIFTTTLGLVKCIAPPLNTEESVTRMGYPFEKYKLQTQDGFKLGLERIPHSKYGGRSIGKPVLLMHGLFWSSYVFTFSNKSLSYSLSNAGYDVWLFNARGTGLSRTYSIYSKPGSSPQMNRMSWDFSFDEMGLYDFPTAIDFITNKTGHAKVDIVGYSLGATISLIGLSEKPEYNRKINKLVLMAPTTRMVSYGFPVIAFHRGSALFKYMMKDRNFFPPAQDPDTIHQYLSWMCSFRILYPYCLLYIMTAQGTIVTYDKNTVASTMIDFPQPVSKKMILHWVQFVSSKKFSKYDYGASENLRRYKTKTPPEYNLTHVHVPTFILHSKNDNLAAKKDVIWLSEKLPNMKGIYYIDKIKFGHLSFVMHPDIERLVNSKIKNALSTSFIS